MQPEEYIYILKKVRRLSPKTIRSLLSILDSAFKDFYQGTYACTIDIPLEKVIYLSNLVPGVENKKVFRKLRLLKKNLYKLVIVNMESSSDIETGSLSAVKIPLYHEAGLFGHFSILISSVQAKGFSDLEINTLSEILSILILPFISTKPKSAVENESELLKEQLLEGLEDNGVMQSALQRMLDLSGAEYCAFYSGGRYSNMHIMLDGRELSSQVSVISKKVINAYGEVTNCSRDSSEYSEKVYYRARKKNVKYLVGNTSIESYFLVRVISDSTVRGVAFFGSCRKNAFKESEISIFNDFDGGAKGAEPIIYRVSGETENLVKFTESIPFGVALVSEDGKIFSENSNFRKILNGGNADYRSVEELSRITGYNFQNIYDEFRIFKNEINDRKIASTKSLNNILRINWISTKTVSIEFNSILMIDYVKEDDIFDDKMLAVVAHEIRTPIAALKNSLEILSQEKYLSGINRSKKGYCVSNKRFFKTAIHTIDRLNLLVDGLIDISSDGITANSLNVEKTGARSFIESVSHIFLKPAEKKGINFSIKSDENLSEIEVDLHKMEQIVQNLLSNSLKNVPAGGRITLSVSPARLPLDTLFSVVPWDRLFDPEVIDISVKDSGDGFPAHIIKNTNGLQEEYLASNKPKSGLGLYIAGNLARSHGGLLRIENNDNKGSTCHIYLPADWRTRKVMKTIITIDDKIREMVKKGAAPIFYLVSKRSEKCWIEIIDKWNSQIVIDPHSGEILETGVYFWPLWEKLAFALAMDRKYLSDPEGLLSSGKKGLRLVNDDWDEQVNIGWGVSLRDGRNTKELITSAMEKLQAKKRVPA